MKFKGFIPAALALALAGNVSANEPDSVYLSPSSSADGKSGLKLSWATDTVGAKWTSIGNGHVFLNSDFGPWGSGKRMYDPILVFDSKDGLWHCYWKSTSSGQTMSHASSRNLVTWSPQTYFNSHGKKYEGGAVKVPFSVVKYLSDQVDHRRWRNALHGQRMADDSSRFANLGNLRAELVVNGGKQKEISRNLIGIFFEDINYGADGGLYAELLQNRDFEYATGEGRRDDSWGPMKAWSTAGGAEVTIATDNPIHANNSHYAVMTPGTLINEGYDGISLRKGEKYDFSCMVRVPDAKKRTITVRLLDADGNAVASCKLSAKSASWKKVSASLTAGADVKNGKLALTLDGGKADLDMISLFPHNTFRNRPNGLRADLAQTFADLKPRFMRFPGGCVAHGNGVDNIYDWKGSIGPLEARKPLRNLWGYHQSRGLGYHEYFQYCEDIGAEPLPVLAAGVPCQNSGMPSAFSHDELTTFGQQGGIPMERMPEYVQDVLDLIEYANGDSKKTEWGRRRAQNGHPKPFNLKYIGIGNEDIITDIFEERFKMIYDAVKAKYPEIVVIGTVGPYYEGTDYDEGWRFASEIGVPMVDEHYYVQPGWMIHNQDYYDRYDRSKPHVYLGEYAAHVPGKRNNMESALAEALHLTAVERNGDVVEMTSYAPLLARKGHTQWSPDMVYFDNDTVNLTTDYWVQHMYGNNAATHAIDHTVSIASKVSDDARKRVAVSAARDEESGELILRLVNLLPVEVKMDLKLNELNISPDGRSITLAGKPGDSDVRPVENAVWLDMSDPNYTLAPYSFTILRFPLVKQPVAVKPAKNFEKGDYGFLYCHMSGRGEWTAYAISRDGLNYEDIRGGEPVFDQKKLAGIEGGTRDAYITRTHDGKGYLMVTTDMCVGKSKKWHNYGINLLRSDDLLNWESTTFDFRKGAEIFSDTASADVYGDYSTILRVWAPQILWNPEYRWPDGRKGGYMIYYSMWNPEGGDTHDRMFYSYADESFTTLTKPRVLLDWGYATIDADINYLESDGLYHMMIKKEGGKPGLFTSTAKNVHGPWSLPVEDDYVDFEGNKKCEGVSAFRIPGEEGWRVAYIEYSSNPRHYRICRADEYLRNFHSPVDISGVEAPQHGSFMRLTKEEYDRLKSWK